MDGPTYDGVVLGAGHNALVLQAYLCRAGLRVLALERATAPGGGLATVENPRHPGFLHNPHSFFHRGATDMPWFRDLELGVRYVEPELNAAMLLRDGRALEWWTDLDRTVASFAEFSRTDAAVLRRWALEFQPIVEQILAPEARSPPLEPGRRRLLLEQSALGRRLLEVSAMSPLEFVQKEFECDAVRAGLLFFNGLREVDLRLRGFGHSIPSLLAAPRKAQMCVGGSAALANALVADVQAHGGQVRCGVELRSILVENGRASGVELSTGERVHARGFVASGLNPQQTFVDLLPAEHVPPSLRKQAAGFEYNVIAPLFAVQAALREPPHYRAAAARPELDRAFLVIIGLEGLDQFEGMVRAHEAGAPPPHVAWGACPTLFDSTQAPPGCHTAFLWHKAPYALHGDPLRWDAEKEAYGRSLLGTWSEYAPNLDRSAVIDVFYQSPLDTERSLPNMRGGDLLVGAFTNGQVGYNRPFPGAGAYRAPIPGLYLCGGSTHPGGNVTGLCGYNAASVIAADAGLVPWWSAPRLEDVLPTA